MRSRSGSQSEGKKGSRREEGEKVGLEGLTKGEEGRDRGR
jgi:hypothetical protein